MGILADRKKNRDSRKAERQAQVAQDRSGNKSYDDERIWSCERNKAGMGSATIRFLEPTDNDRKYWVEERGHTPNSAPFYTMHHAHSFKGKTGKWYINHCPTTVVERDCPICEMNSELVNSWGGWDSVDDSHIEKQLVRSRKRREVYHANILIVDDKVNPENNGTVRIFKYGKAIHKMVMDQLVPEFEDEADCDVSDYVYGRDFKLKIVKAEADGYSNYDKSSWAPVAAIGKTDEAIQKIIDSQFDLSSFIAEDKFKPYEQLAKELQATQSKSVQSEVKEKEEVVEKEKEVTESTPIATSENVDEFFNDLLDE